MDPFRLSLKYGDKNSRIKLSIDTPRTIPLLFEVRVGNLENDTSKTSPDKRIDSPLTRHLFVEGEVDLGHSIVEVLFSRCICSVSASSFSSLLQEKLEQVHRV